MSNSIYVTATQRGSGKSAVALGLISQLERTLGRVGYFKPVGGGGPGGVDPDVRLMKDVLGLTQSLEEICPVTMEQVTEALGQGVYDQLLDTVLEAYEQVAANYDFVVCEGTDYFGAMASFEFDINADLSSNLSSPILLVANAMDYRGGGAEDPEGEEDQIEAMTNNIAMVKESFDEKNCEVFGVIINRADPGRLEAVNARAQAGLEALGVKLLGSIPRAEMLERVRIEEVAAALGAEVISGAERLGVVAQGVGVAAMSLENVLDRLPRGCLVVVPGDRDDVLLGLAAAYVSPAIPACAGVIMSGGMQPHKRVMELILDLTGGNMPLLKVQTDTYDTAIAVNGVQPCLQAHQRTRVEIVKGLVERHVNIEPLLTRGVVGSVSKKMTPKQFLHRILDLARNDRRHIVLPEGAEERILRASSVLLQRGVCDITLLGDEDEVRSNIGRLGLKLDEARVLDPRRSEWREAFARRYQELRAPKRNPTWELAYDLMSDPTYFGTMMVQEGEADGMVSGSINTTANTLRPALEFIKTAEGYKIASSVFMMCLPDKVLVYGDCAVNPDPTAEQLADIAIASATTAAAFDIEPLVAMLSYSTGSSGQGADVEKVREATALVKERAPDLLVEGPIQYDAAVDPGVAATKLPDSRVAGKATVFIFPDLNSGNNTYKAVQRSAKAIAIGPVMQGLRKPVNDLSRGCTVPDIINTVAITSIQAQRK